MSLSITVADLIARFGQTMTLKRAGETDLSLKGKRIGGTTDDVGGSAAQQVLRVKIGTSELLASNWATKEPKRKDTLVFDGRERTVLDVRPLRDGETVALYELDVAG